MAQFRLALEKQLGYHPALFGLGDLCVAERDWAGLDGIIAKLKMMPKVAVEAEVFRARAHQARGEFAAARAVLEAAIQEYQLATPRLVLAHVLMQEGLDLAATEQALRAVLAMDPAPRRGRTWTCCCGSRGGRGVEPIRKKGTGTARTRSQSPYFG